MNDPQLTTTDDEVLHALFESQKALENARHMLLTIAIPTLDAVAELCEHGATEARLKQAIRRHEQSMGRIA